MLQYLLRVLCIALGGFCGAASGFVIPIWIGMFESWRLGDATQVQIYSVIAFFSIPGGIALGFIIGDSFYEWLTRSGNDCNCD